jgi:very-short-patch-repair endonuclease
VQELARRQHGVVSRAQLSEAGMTARQIGRLLAEGELRPLHRGVYLLGPVTPLHARELAAVLACAPKAALGHHSATYLYELLPYPRRPHPVDVIVTGHHPGRHPGIRLHRTATLAPHELRERAGIPITSVPRTLIDLAACCSPTQLEAAVAEAFALGLPDRSQLLRLIRGHPGRRGVAILRAQLGGERKPARTRSRPERTLLREVRDAGLPEPEVNVKLGRWEVDLLWRDAGLVVEIDAYATHSSPRAFERDRRKSAELEDLGLTVRRVSDRQIRDQTVLTVRRIRRALRELTAE